MSLSARFLPLVALGALAFAATGCGGDDQQTPASAKAGAKTLTQAMNRAAAAFDDLSPTRASLDRFSQDITAPISLTGDVIGLLTGDNETERLLLTAARQQRTFLQASDEAASSRTRTAALRAADRARTAGRLATASYSRAVSADDGLAGLVPPATAFNTAQLRAAVRGAYRSTSSSTTSKKSTTSGGAEANRTGGSQTSGVTDCGGGVSAGNSATSCPFARNVADEFRASGGQSVIEVYSPVTGRTYTMSCTGAGPVRCTGGNGAVVLVR